MISSAKVLQIFETYKFADILPTELYYFAVFCMFVIARTPVY